MRQAQTTVASQAIAVQPKLLRAHVACQRCRQAVGRGPAVARWSLGREREQEQQRCRRRYCFDGVAALADMYRRKARATKRLRLLL